VAVSLRHPVPGTPVAPEVRRAVRDTAQILEAEGHRVAGADPPYPADVALRFVRRWLAGIAEDAAGLDEALLEDRTRRMARAGRLLKRRGWAAPVADDGWAERVRRWFEGYDVLVMPTVTRTAPPAAGYRRGGWIRTTYRTGNWVATPVWNVAGVAAASVPAGLGADGLPLAVQLVAPAGGERRLLEVARRIEARRPFPQWTPARL
jgi:amidase